MGRLVKNLALHSGSYAIRLPVGTSTIGPQKPQPGQVRFNESINNLEVYYSDEWHAFTQAGRVTITTDRFIGDGIRTTFQIENGPTGAESYVAGQEADLMIFVGNVYQEPGIAYTLSGADLEFTSPPPDGQRIIVLHNFNSTHVR